MLLHKEQKFVWMTSIIISFLYEFYFLKAVRGELKRMKALNSLAKKKSTLQLP